MLEKIIEYCFHLQMPLLDTAELKTHLEAANSETMFVEDAV